MTSNNKSFSFLTGNLAGVVIENAEKNWEKAKKTNS